MVEAGLGCRGPGQENGKIEAGQIDQLRALAPIAMLGQIGGKRRQAGTALGGARLRGALVIHPALLEGLGAQVTRRPAKTVWRDRIVERSPGAQTSESPRIAARIASSVAPATP